jgi:hypothetical protein
MGLFMKIKRDELAEIVENGTKAGAIGRIRAAFGARGLPARLFGSGATAPRRSSASPAAPSCRFLS